VIGEGENTVIELVELLEEHEALDTMRYDLHTIDGIIYRDKDELQTTSPRKLMTEEELNELPYPAWDLLPLEVYFQYSRLDLSPEAMLAQRRMDVIAQRGCPFKCTFCFHNLLGGCDLEKPVRFQSPEYIVEMIKEMRFRYGIDFISFLDESITTKPARLEELCELMDSSGLSQYIRWGCLGRPDQLTYPMLEKMRKTGCTYISMGGESANDIVLKNIKKNTNKEQIAQAIRYCMRAGIQPTVTFMTGFSKEYLEELNLIDEMIETVEFWEKYQITCRPFLITPYPATEMFEEYKDEILDQYEPLDEPLREFVRECGDATKLVTNLSQYTDIELLGLRELMITKDLKRLKKFRKFKERFNFSVVVEDD
jgi:radical SAM superfamily enzyme YgiQ (UPF0313 family)